MVESDRDRDERLRKLEGWAHSEGGYQPRIDTPPTEGNIHRKINDLESVIKGKDNMMGLETKVKIMWWFNHLVGFVLGYACQAVIAKVFK